MSGGKCKAAICCGQLGCLLTEIEQLIETDQIDDDEVIRELADVADKCRERMSKIVVDFANRDD